MARPGQELTDPSTCARLRFVETAASSGGRRVALRLVVGERWSAGPLHVHPAQTERMRIVDGTFVVCVDDGERVCGPGDDVIVPPGAKHTIRSSRGGRLEVEFAPSLRTDELFETMFRADSPRRPPDFVPAPLRAWVESRGFGREIRYLWPRRLAFATCAAAAVGLLARRLR